MTKRWRARPDSRVRHAHRVSPFTEPETIYTTTYVPNRERAEDVLAFLLVPEEVFFEQSTSDITKQEVRDMLREAKVAALMHWYAHHTKEQG